MQTYINKVVHKSVFLQLIKLDFLNLHPQIKKLLIYKSFNLNILFL